MPDDLLNGLPPLVGASARALVLGSFPSVTSLQASRYYGHPRNHFWAILSLAWKDPAPADWPERGTWLEAHGLALWDVIGSCRRNGSLDQDIRDAVPNDVASLVAAHASIRRILVNGGTAGSLFRRHILPRLDSDWAIDPGSGFAAAGGPVRGGSGPRLIFFLPSTSPIPTRQYRSAEDKLPLWRQALGAAEP